IFGSGRVVGFVWLVEIFGAARGTRAGAIDLCEGAGCRAAGGDPTAGDARAGAEGQAARRWRCGGGVVARTGGGPGRWDRGLRTAGNPLRAAGQGFREGAGICTTCSCEIRAARCAFARPLCEGTLAAAGGKADVPGGAFAASDTQVRRDRSGSVAGKVGGGEHGQPVEFG